MAIPKASKPKAVAVRPARSGRSRGPKPPTTKGTYRIPGYRVVAWKSKCPRCGGEMNVRTTSYSYTEVCDGHCSYRHQSMTRNAEEYFRLKGTSNGPGPAMVMDRERNRRMVGA